MATFQRIALLPPRLANQIAAGEVVERPASVIKELIENSLDAGATRIDIDLEHAGIRRMTVTDNGSGIHRDDLVLALARHATSKIRSTDDLAAVNSLGFRGEALASVASIARLTLTSRAMDAELAWSAFAEGADMHVTVQPAALNNGSRVDVTDLFFNTPARRRFLRSESTELQHIEEVIKRAALAAPHCGFFVKHNGKPLKQWRATTDINERARQVVGESFVHHALSLEHHVDQVQLSGLIGAPSAHRAQADLQFVFVNGRVIRDRVVQHALRAGFADQIPEGRSPAYILFITMPPHDVDVNVHPTKHEVRFRHARWMHDLLTASVAQTLNEHEPVSVDRAPIAKKISHESAPAVAETLALYQTFSASPRPTLTQTTTGLMPLASPFVLFEFQQQQWLVDWPALLQCWLTAELPQVALRPLMLPQTLSPAINSNIATALRLQTKNDGQLLTAAPACLADCDWSTMLLEQNPGDDVIAQVAQHLAQHHSSSHKTIVMLRQWLAAQSLETLPMRQMDAAFLQRVWAL